MMNGQWTYAENEKKWKHPETFSTKEEVIKKGKIRFEKDFYVGHLVEYHNDRFKVIKMERIEI